MVEPVERVADGEVPLQGDGARQVDGAGEADLRQRQHERQGVRVGEGGVEARRELRQREDEGAHADVAEVEGGQGHHQRVEVALDALPASAKVDNIHFIQILFQLHTAVRI